MKGLMTGYMYLLIAIVAEVIATSALKASEGFTKTFPSVVVVVGYGLAFYCFSVTLKTVPVGVAYAIWAGLGIALITVVGWIVFKQMLDVPAIIGILLIVSGVGILTLLSKSSVQ